MNKFQIARTALSLSAILVAGSVSAQSPEDVIKAKFPETAGELAITSNTTYNKALKNKYRELYKKIFEDAGFKNVYIVPESNGALAYFEKTNNVLEECGSGKKLFLIDLGAYSIDATPYFGGALGTSYGKYLGASLIERMILRTILYGDEQKFRKGKKIINMPETLKAARALYENPNTHEKFSSYMLLQTRKFMEKYFTYEIKGKLPHGNSTFNSGFYVGEEDDEEELILFTNPDMIKILMEKTPICKVLGDEFETLPAEVIDYVGNLTWMGTFRKFLGELGKEYKVADEGADAVIMLTGGGSLMKCVAEEVKKFFSKARVHYDPKAISAIGQGIGLWAPDKIKATDFQKTFRRFCKSELESVIIPVLTEAFKDCVSDVGSAVTTEERDAVNFGINQWKTYQCHSSNIPSKIESHFKSWCANKNAATFISKLENRLNNLKVRFNEDFKNEVLRPLNMMTGNLQNDIFLEIDDKISFPVSKELFEHVFNFLTQQIIDYYKRNDIWQNIPNPSDGFFTNPRRSFYNDNAIVLNNWLDNNISATSALCEKYFCEDNLPIERPVTLLNFFMLEVFLVFLVLF